jgi:UDP-N-acetylglucosamine 1-carboxyvinyltransferase
MKMEKFVIEGGYPLSGELIPSGNKNEALPVLAATLLTDEEVTLQNLPKIRDVEVMCEVIRSVGGQAEWVGPNELKVCAGGVKTGELDAELCRRIRASILFAGPLIARQGRVVLPPPGGDVIGRRRLDTHFHALEALGARIAVRDVYELTAAQLSGADIFLDEASVTATENAIMAASLAKGTTIIRNAACEPHVCNLARMLNSMGAQISGIGSNQLTIQGVERLGGTTHEIESDYLEIGSFVGLAAVTGGELTIKRVKPESLRMIRLVFERLGVFTQLKESPEGGHELFVPAHQPLTVKPDYHNHVPKIDNSIWPAFPTDLMSIAITVATQCKGTVLFFEKMFEGRMFFVDHLQGMGAQIILCDPHRVVVVGPQPLRGAKVQSPDVRAGMALLIAGLAAKGKTEIYNIHQIDRGYERVDEKLRLLGAQIERLPADA